MELLCRIHFTTSGRYTNLGKRIARGNPFTGLDTLYDNGQKTRLYLSNKGVASLYTSSIDNDSNWIKKGDVVTSADSLKIDDYLTLNSGYGLTGDNGMIKFGNVIMLVLTIKKNNGVYPDSNNSPVAKLKKHLPMFQVNTACVLGTSEWNYNTTDYLYIAINGDIRVCTSATSGNSNFARATVCYITK